MRRMRRSLTMLVLLPALAAWHRSPAAGAPEPASFTALEQTALAELKETGTPGCAVAVVQGEQVVYARGFGKASVEQETAVTPDTLFRIGSTTKMFTAAAALSLAEDGKLHLDAPIGTHLRGLPPHLAAITLHQLLTHTAGLHDAAEPYGSRDERALVESVREWKDDRLFEEPGRVFSYSNPGYNLAGAVLETAASKPFADAVEERVFRPLGMHRTTFRSLVAATHPLAQGHVPGENGGPAVVRPYTENVTEWPSGFLFSSASDLARWAAAFVNGGKLEGKQVLSPTLVRKLSTPHVDIQDVFLGKYGYGLMVHEDRGVRFVDHGGVHIGFTSQLKLVPDRRFAVIVLGNGSTPLTRTLEKALELGLGPLPPKPAPPAPVPVPREEAERAAGRYGTPPRVVELAVKDASLVQRQGQAELPVQRVGPNRYSVRPPGAPASFEFVLVPGPDGKPAYFGADFHKLKRLPAEPRDER